MTVSFPCSAGVEEPEARAEVDSEVEAEGATPRISEMWMDDL
jgi:hypothetical protein